MSLLSSYALYILDNISQLLLYTHQRKKSIQPFNSGTFLCESVRKRRRIKNTVSGGERFAVPFRNLGISYRDEALFNDNAVRGATHFVQTIPSHGLTTAPHPDKIFRQIPSKSQRSPSLLLTASSKFIDRFLRFARGKYFLIKWTATDRARLEGFYPEKCFPAAPVLLCSCLIH